MRTEGNAFMLKRDPLRASKSFLWLLAMAAAAAE